VKVAIRIAQKERQEEMIIAIRTTPVERDEEMTVIRGTAK
jgi:hypothetical protein